MQAALKENQHSLSRQIDRQIVKSLSRVQLFATPWTVAHQAPLSVGFSRQEQWSGLTFPSPGNLPNSGIKPRSPKLQADTLPSEPPGKPATLADVQIPRLTCQSLTNYCSLSLTKHCVQLLQEELASAWQTCASGLRNTVMPTSSP